MKRQLFATLGFLFILVPGLQSLQSQVIDCFSVVVGKTASVDGSVILAHNEDDGAPQYVGWYRVPRLKHAAGEVVTLKNGAQIPQVNETNSYLWLQMPTMDFCDSYMNEWGVTIASNQCFSQERNGQLTDGGIGYWLRRLMSERAKTAKEAVKIGGALIEKLGYASSGRSYIIADSHEAWVMAAVNGKHWVAQRVPDDHVMVIPNYYTIEKIDLADTNNYLGAADLIDYARRQDWYNPHKDGDFNFCQIYSDPGNLEAVSNVRRMWRGVNLLAEKQYKMDDTFPFSFQPKKRLALADIMAVLRDHYEGTPYDPTRDYQTGSPNQTTEPTICAEINQYGFVAQLRSWLPIDLGAVLWIAPRRPDTQPFIPCYCGIEAIPPGFFRGDYKTAIRQHFNPPEDIHEPDLKLAYWSFTIFAERIDEDYKNAIQAVHAKRDALENGFLKQQSGFEKKIEKLFRQNPKAAKAELTRYTTDAANQAWDLTR